MVDKSSNWTTSSHPVAQKVAQLLSASAASGLITHAYAAFGKISESGPVLSVALHPGGREIFDLASLTKALVTTPLVFKALTTGVIGLDSTIGEWLGDQVLPLSTQLKALTVRSLLRHDAGLPAWRNFWTQHLGVQPDSYLRSPERRITELTQELNRVRPIEPGGIRSVYSDVGFILVGLALEVVGRESLAIQFKRFCNDELKIHSKHGHLGFCPEPTLADKIVPTAYCAVRQRHLCGEVHDENCASLGGVAGHAGLFGTGQAIAQFLWALPKVKAGRLLLDGNAQAIARPPGTPPNEALMGWRQGADQSSAPFAQGLAMGHMGFTGVAFWVCPDRGDYAILLTNRIQAGRTVPGIQALRREVFAALAMAAS